MTLKVNLYYHIKFGSKRHVQVSVFIILLVITNKYLTIKYVYKKLKTNKHLFRYNI